MKRIHMNLELSPDMDERLGAIAAQLQTSRADVLRKAIALIDIAARAKAQGLRIGLVGIDAPLDTEIVGL